MSKKILFFGNERLATGVSTHLPILRQLVLNGYHVSAIVVTPLNSLPSRQPRLLEVVNFAGEHNIPLLEISNLQAASDQLRPYNATVGVLAAFGKIIPQETIDIFPGGIVNVHPSLLPKHRGPIPIEASILRGEDETGVSLMQLVAEMDAGPIYDQIKLPLQGNETKQHLANVLGTVGSKRLIERLPLIIDGSLEGKTQSGEATYDKRIGPELSQLIFTKPAIQLEREIRAYAGWPRSRATIRSQPVIITQASVITSRAQTPGTIWRNNNLFGFHTTHGVLVIERLVPPGSREMSASDYLRGHEL